jgi:hypothetical protein
MAVSTMSMSTRAALGTLAEAMLAAVEVNLYRLNRVKKTKMFSVLINVWRNN